MRRRPICKWKPKPPLRHSPCGNCRLFGISSCFHELSRSYRQVAHVLLTHPPLSFTEVHPKASFDRTPHDLHVLGTPPAFVLSQDQTLQKETIRLYKSKVFKRICLARFVSKLLTFTRCSVFKVPCFV